MTRVVINACFGGFGLSPLATKRWAELNGRECHFFWATRDRSDYNPEAVEAFNDWYQRHSINLRDIRRDDPHLLQIVEELGDKANGSFAKLRVVEIPDGVEWCIEEYDGNEHVAEVHRTWS